MADLNANINVGIETTDALNQLKNLQRQISQFHQSVSKSSATAATAQRDLQRNFLNSVNAIQGFSAELKTVRTTAESFTNSLEKNKFSMREYFRFAAGATKTFGKSFAAEFSTIEKTAIERVKTLQTQYIKMGRDASGAMQAIAIRPTVLNMKDLGTQTAIAAQKQVLFNQLVKQGSTNLLNFGKNTQWAGRQLMVGFTLPLATLGMTAGRVFMDMEKAALKFRKVYGDLFTPTAEREAALESIVELGQAFTAYGVSVAESLDTAADAAAAGFAGVDLQNQTAAALKLSVLGQLELQKALETTISLQNAFQLSSASLAGEIDFLNAVENQTVVALSDITEAVPRVAPVIQQLGGDVRDLAFFLAAMKEGGVNAAQGANALKSGLASLINPTEKAATMLAGVGINIRSIISANQGNLAGIVFEFAQALDKLDPLKRAQAIEQLFGKFQFARLSALFDNITRDGTQAQRVLELAGSTAEELASLSESELGIQAASSMNKFRKAVEGIKVALVPIGELFVEIATPFVEFGTKMLDAFNTLPEGIKKGIGAAVTIIGGLGPIALMTFGLINNGIANMIKFFATVRLGYLKITGQAQGIGDETQYMTQEQLEAAAAAASLDQAHSNLIQRFTAEKIVVDKLRDAYSQAVAAGARFANLNPGMMLPGRGPQKFAQGGFVSGSGNGDTVPAMLTPGEFVVKKDIAQGMLPFLEALNAGKIGKFAQGGEIEPFIGAAAARANKTSSANAITRFLQIDLGKVLDTGSETLRQEFVQFIEDYVRNTEVITKKGLREALVKQREMMLQYAPQRFQGEKTEFAHIGGGLRTTAGTVASGASANITDQALSQLIGRIASVMPDAQLDLKSGFGFDIQGRINNLMDKSGASIEEFLTDFNSRGPEKWRTMVEVGGGSFDALLPEIEKYEQVLKQKVQAALNSGATRIVDTQKQIDDMRARAIEKGDFFDESTFVSMERLDAETRADLARFGGELNGVIETAIGTITEIRMKMTRLEQQMLAEQGINIDFGQASGGGFRNTGKLGGTSRVVGGSGQMIFNDQLATTAQTNSESRRTKQIAKDTVDGYANELQRGASTVEDTAQKTIQGVVSVAAKPQTGPRRFSTNPAVMQALASASALAAPQSFRNPRRFMAPAGPPGGFNPGDPGFVGPLNKEMSELKYGLQNSNKGFENFAGKLSKISLATSAVSGVLTIFGGEMSAVSGVVLGLSSAMFALIEITSLLSKTKIGEMAASRAATVAAGMGGTLGSLLGTGGFITRIANGFKFILRFLGPVGIGLSALAIAVPFVIDMFEKQKNKMEAFGKIVDVTADQIRFLGEQSGASVTTTSGFERATLGGGTEVASDAAIQNQKDEQFLEKFQTQIAATKVGAQESVNQALSLLAFKLSSSGLPDDVVNATIAGIIRASERTDLKFDFNSVGLSEKNVQGLVGGIRGQIEEINKAGTTTSTGFNTATISVPGTTVSNASAQQLKDLGTNVATMLEGLSVQLERGSINVEQYGLQFDELRTSLVNLDSAAQDAAMNAAIDKLFPEDKKMADAIKGISGIEEQMLLLELAGVGGTEAMEKFVDIMKDDSKSRLQKRLQIKSEIAAQKQLNLVAEAGNQISEQETEAQTIRDKIQTYKDLKKAGVDAALAYKIAGDAALTEGYKTALAAGSLMDWIKGIEEIERLSKKFENIGSQITGVGGGSAADPFRDAVENLKKQKQEILNTSRAYSQLRRSGMDAQKAIRFAENPDLLSAMAAGVKAGTKQWDELIRRIQAAERATRKWQKTTVQGQTELFEDVFGKVSDYFNSQEELLRVAFEKSTEESQKVVDTLEKQIKNINTEIEGYSRNLDEIAFKENEINAQYDKKVKALEQTKKVNEDILRQQKSQLSIADALSQGDVAAAASAMQELRSQNAASALQTQGDQLELARNAQLAALTSSNGLTRAQNEQKIAELKQQILTIENGSLATARAAIAAGEDRLEQDIKALNFAGQTRTQWEAQSTAIEAAQAKAIVFNSKAKEILGTVTSIVAQWNAMASGNVSVPSVPAPKAGTSKTQTTKTNTTQQITPPPTTKTAVQTPQFTKAQIEAKERAAAAAAAKPQFTQVGNVIKRNFANGGLVSGIGNKDTIPAMLTPGEFVINKKATESFKPLLSAVNYGNFNKPIYPEFSRNYASENIGGGIYTQTSSPETNTRVDNSVYNYNLNVNVEGTNATPDQIANVVMRKLQTVGSQRVRGQVVR